MASKILAGVFWATSALLLLYAVSLGGWAWAIPGTAAVIAAMFAADLLRHRELVDFDLALLRTLLHVVSAAVVAATCMYWLGVLVLSRGS